MIWQCDCNPKDAVFGLLGRATRSDFMGMPVVYKSRIYVGLGQDLEHRTGPGRFLCIDINKRGDVSPELRDGRLGLSGDRSKVDAIVRFACLWYRGELCALARASGTHVVGVCDLCGEWTFIRANRSAPAWCRMTPHCGERRVGRTHWNGTTWVVDPRPRGRLVPVSVGVKSWR